MNGPAEAAEVNGEATDDGDDFVSVFAVEEFCGDGAANVSADESASGCAAVSEAAGAEAATVGSGLSSRGTVFDSAGLGFSSDASSIRITFSPQYGQTLLSTGICFPQILQYKTSFAKACKPRETIITKARSRQNTRFMVFPTFPIREANRTFWVYIKAKTTIFSIIICDDGKKSKQKQRIYNMIIELTN
ncbi:MAG: hypothetical protein II885_00850 [Oscillospiraceae bacterium]|nr:hypothetical protein [Oscillospiraceae bacterium]